MVDQSDRADQSAWEGGKVIRWIFGCLRILITPSIWVQLDRYSKEWDKALIFLMQKNEFKQLDEFYCDLGGIRIWTCNFPYASMQATLSNPIALSAIVDTAGEKNLSSNQLLAQSSLAIADALLAALAAEPDAPVVTAAKGQS